MPPASRSPAFRLAAAGVVGSVDAGAGSSGSSAPPSTSSTSTFSTTTTTTTTPEKNRRRISSLNVSSSSSPESATRETAHFLPKSNDSVGDDHRYDGEEDESVSFGRGGGGGGGGLFGAFFGTRRKRFFLPASSSSATPSKDDHRRKHHHHRLLDHQNDRFGRFSFASFVLAAALAAVASLSALAALAAVADASAAALYERAALAGMVPPDAHFWDRWEASLLLKAAGGSMSVSLERHWLRERAELTSRRLRTVAAVALGRFHFRQSKNDDSSKSSTSSHSPFLAFPPALPEFLESTCADLRGDYAPLIAADLEPWPSVSREQVESDPDRLYFVRVGNGGKSSDGGGAPRAFLPKEANRGRLMPTFHAFFERLALRVSLPDVVIPLNVADEPRAPWVEGRVWGATAAEGEGGEGAEAALLRGEAVVAAAAKKDGEEEGDDDSEGKEKSSSRINAVENSKGKKGDEGRWWPRLGRKKDGKGGGGTAATTMTTSANDAAADDNNNNPNRRRRRTKEDPPDPLFSFCKTDEYADILIPNTIEGDVFVRPRDGGSGSGKRKKRDKNKNSSSSPPTAEAADDAADGLLSRAASLLPRVAFPFSSSASSSVTTHRKTRAGTSDDARPATAVWRGSTGGFGGLAKGRAALLRLGQERPDLIDSGVYDWDEAKWGPPEGRVKARMGLADQVEGHKYLVWAPGNCASVRLALQLASDAIVLKIDSSGEREWYYPLLKPYVHYVPIDANETFVGVEEGVAWAESHPKEARGIVLAANAFAERYLGSRGRYCYAAQLLSEFASRFQASGGGGGGGGSEDGGGGGGEVEKFVVLPEGAVAVPGVADRPDLEKPE